MRNRVAATAVFLISILTGCSHPQPVAYYPPPPPPPALAQIENQGFHDGMAAARHDLQTGLPPDLGRHPRFRNPPVPPPAIEAYRRGFRNGYGRIVRPVRP
jgi:hypothetical protein